MAPCRRSQCDGHTALDPRRMGRGVSYGWAGIAPPHIPSTGSCQQGRRSFHTHDPLAPRSFHTSAAALFGIDCPIALVSYAWHPSSGLGGYSFRPCLVPFPVPCLAPFRRLPPKAQAPFLGKVRSSLTPWGRPMGPCSPPCSGRVVETCQTYTDRRSGMGYRRE